MVQKGDHLYIAHVEDLRSRAVVRVKFVDPHGVIVAKSACHYHLKNLSDISFKEKDDSNFLIIANLGQIPAVPNIGDCPTKSYIGIKTLEGFGKIYFFYKPFDKQELAFILDSFALAYERIKANNLEVFLDGVQFAIHNSLTYKISSKTQGYYEPSCGNICIFPDRHSEKDELSHTVLHELAHHIYMYVKKQEQLMTDWTEAYYSISSAVEVSADKIKSLVVAFLVSGQPLSLYVKILDNTEEDAIIKLTDRKLFKMYASMSAKYYGLKYADLELFSRQDKFDLLDKILLSKINPCIIRVVNTAKSTSIYSTKSLKEFFAETISYFIGNKGGKLPQQELARLAARTLSYTKACATTKQDE